MSSILYDYFTAGIKSRLVLVKSWAKANVKYSSFVLRHDLLEKNPQIRLNFMNFVTVFATVLAVALVPLIQLIALVLFR